MKSFEIAELKSDLPTFATKFIPGDTRKTVFLGQPAPDKIMHVILAMGADMWATKRRLKIIESILAAKRDVTPQTAESYVPTRSNAA